MFGCRRKGAGAGVNTGTPIDKLQKAIERRQKELLAATEVLAKNARWFSARASIVTVLTVVLGAFVATRDGLSKLFPETQFHGSEFVLGILFLLVGLIIACVAGIEAAFRFRDKAAELRALSATCAATRRRIDT